MIEILLLVNYRLRKFSVLIAILMLVKYKLCRRNVVTEILMLVNIGCVGVAY